MSRFILSTTLHSVRNVRQLSVVGCNKTSSTPSNSDIRSRDLCTFRLRNSAIRPVTRTSVAARWCSSGTLSSVSGASFLSSKHKLVSDVNSASDTIQMRENITQFFTNCASDDDLALGITKRPFTDSFPASETATLSSDSASDITSPLNALSQSFSDTSETITTTENIRLSFTDTIADTAPILGGMTELSTNSGSYDDAHTASLTGTDTSSGKVFDSAGETSVFASETEIPPVIGSVPESPVSDSTSVTDILSGLPEIPAPPSPPIDASSIEKALELLQNGEPSLGSLGLGGLGPVGIIEEALMYIHVQFGLPWWGTIVLAACTLRVAMFPLTLKSQRASALMTATLPRQTELYEKFTEARRLDDPFLVYKYSKELQELQKSTTSPFAAIWPGLAQIPAIYCFFSALREMSNFPVESFKTGGTLWFVDLTTRDYYYGLPILTSIGLFAMLKMSTTAFSTMKYGAYVPYAIAPVSFFITMYFNNAIAVYWVAASFINLGQAHLLKSEPVRAYLKLPPMAVRPSTASKNPKAKNIKTWYKDIRKNMDNSRIAREVEDRFRLDSIAFEQAGKEPIKRTFKVDPTKVIEAKK